MPPSGSASIRSVRRNARRRGSLWAARTLAAERPAVADATETALNARRPTPARPRSARPPRRRPAPPLREGPHLLGDRLAPQRVDPNQLTRDRNGGPARLQGRQGGSPRLRKRGVRRPERRGRRPVASVAGGQGASAPPTTLTPAPSSSVLSPSQLPPSCMNVSSAGPPSAARTRGPNRSRNSAYCRSSSRGVNRLPSSGSSRCRSRIPFASSSRQIPARRRSERVRGDAIVIGRSSSPVLLNSVGRTNGAAGGLRAATRGGKQSGPADPLEGARRVVPAVAGPRRAGRFAGRGGLSSSGPGPRTGGTRLQCDTGRHSTNPERTATKTVLGEAGGRVGSPVLSLRSLLDSAPGERAPNERA